MILSGHEPYPAVAVDRVWNMIAANSAMLALTEAVDIDPELLEPPINVMRVGPTPAAWARCSSTSATGTPTGSSGLSAN